MDDGLASDEVVEGESELAEYVTALRARLTAAEKVIELSGERMLSINVAEYDQAVAAWKALVWD